MAKPWEPSLLPGLLNAMGGPPSASSYFSPRSSPAGAAGAGLRSPSSPTARRRESDQRARENTLGRLSSESLTKMDVLKGGAASDTTEITHTDADTLSSRMRYGRLGSTHQSAPTETDYSNTSLALIRATSSKESTLEGLSGQTLKSRPAEAKLGIDSDKAVIRASLAMRNVDRGDGQSGSVAEGLPPPSTRSPRSKQTAERIPTRPGSSRHHIGPAVEYARGAAASVLSWNEFLDLTEQRHSVETGERPDLSVSTSGIPRARRIVRGLSNEHVRTSASISVARNAERIRRSVSYRDDVSLTQRTKSSDSFFVEVKSAIAKGSGLTMDGAEWAKQRSRRRARLDRTDAESDDAAQMVSSPSTTEPLAPFGSPSGVLSRQRQASPQPIVARARADAAAPRPHLASCKAALPTEDPSDAGVLADSVAQSEAAAAKQAAHASESQEAATKADVRPVTAAVLTGGLAAAFNSTEADSSPVGVESSSPLPLLRNSSNEFHDLRQQLAARYAELIQKQHSGIDLTAVQSEELQRISVQLEGSDIRADIMHLHAISVAMEEEATLLANIAKPRTSNTVEAQTGPWTTAVGAEPEHSLALETCTAVFYERPDGECAETTVVELPSLVASGVVQPSTRVLTESMGGQWMEMREALAANELSIDVSQLPDSQPIGRIADTKGELTHALKSEEVVAQEPELKHVEPEPEPEPEPEIQQLEPEIQSHTELEPESLRLMPAKASTTETQPIQEIVSTASARGDVSVEMNPQLETLKQAVTEATTHAVLTQTTLRNHNEEHKRAAAAETQVIADMKVEADARAAVINTMALRMQQAEETARKSTSLAQADAQAAARCEECDVDSRAAEIKLAAVKSAELATTHRAAADAARDAHSAEVAAETARAAERTAALAAAKVQTVSTQIQAKKTAALLADASQQREAALARCKRLLESKLTVVKSRHASHIEAVRDLSEARANVERAEADAAAFKAQLERCKAALLSADPSDAGTPTVSRSVEQDEAALLDAEQVLQEKRVAMQAAQASALQQAAAQAEAWREAKQVTSVTAAALKAGLAVAFNATEADGAPIRVQTTAAAAGNDDTMRWMDEALLALEATQNTELALAQQHDSTGAEDVGRPGGEPPVPWAASKSPVPAPVGSVSFESAHDSSLAGGASTEAIDSRSLLQERVTGLLPNLSTTSPLQLHRNSSTGTSHSGSPLNLTPYSPRTNWRNPVLDDLQAHLQRLSPKGSD